MAVSRTIHLDDMTAEELAELFCEMGSNGQAEFFNVVGHLTKSWPNGGWCYQACEIVRSRALTEDGRTAIERLADHYALQQGEAA